MKNEDDICTEGQDKLVTAFYVTAIVMFFILLIWWQHC